MNIQMELHNIRSILRHRSSRNVSVHQNILSKVIVKLNIFSCEDVEHFQAKSVSNQGFSGCNRPGNTAVYPQQTCIVTLLNYYAQQLTRCSSIVFCICIVLRFKACSGRRENEDDVQTRQIIHCIVVFFFFEKMFFQETETPRLL